MCYLFILIWDKGFKEFWGLKRLCGFYNPQAIANAMHMCIYSYHRLMIKHMQDHFCSFFSDSGKFYKLSFRLGDSPISLSKNLRSFPKVFGFGFVKSDRFDWLLKVFKAHLKNIFRLFNFLEKWGGNFIDLLVSSLCWKCHSNEKLKSIIKIELGLSIGIKLEQISKNLI